MKSIIENLFSQTPDRLLTDQEERKLIERTKEGDKEARAKLAKYNNRLVVSIAKDYRGMGVPFEDLLMAGFVGLLRGIDKFDPETGNKLSTYVTWWIKQAVYQELNEQSTTIRVPGYVRKVQRQVNRMEKSQEEELTHEEISNKFGISEEVARKVKQTSPAVSLDSPFSDSEDTSLVDLMEDRKAKKPQELAQPKDQLMEEALEEKLSDRERRIVKLYYGIEDYKPRTLEEVSEVFDLSRERIRQLRDRALEKLAADEELAKVRGR